MRATTYRGRLAPSPTGYLHLGHAKTFWTAQERARAHGGTLILRSEDLDCHRARPEFATAMLDDLRWFGLGWQEGPDCGGAFGPYTQSERSPVGDTPPFSEVRTTAWRGLPSTTASAATFVSAYTLNGLGASVSV